MQKSSLIHANSDKLINVAPLEDALLSWHPLQFPWCCIPSAPASSASFPHWLKPHQQLPMRRLAVDVVIILYVLQCTCDWRDLHSIHRCLQNIYVHAHKSMNMSPLGKWKTGNSKYGAMHGLEKKGELNRTEMGRGEKESSFHGNREGCL